MGQINDAGSRLDAFQRSISTISGQFSTADSALSSVVTALNRAISVGVQGANGTLSDTDRADAAAELQGIQSQLIGLANTSYQGQFIFGGTGQVPPYVEDSTMPSGVRYDGNDGVNRITIGNLYQIQANLPGSQVFSSAGSDVFQSLHDLITSLQTNSGIDTALTSVRKAFDHVTSQRVFYGNALNQTQAQQSYLDLEKVDLSQQTNAVSAADMAETATQLANGQTAMSATLAAMGRVLQGSLFDYLK